MSDVSNGVVVDCAGVSRTYQEDAVPVHALRGVDFEFSRGDFVSLSGPSGSGKSTLLNLIGGWTARIPAPFRWTAWP